MESVTIKVEPGETKTIFISNGGHVLLHVEIDVGATSATVATSTSSARIQGGENIFVCANGTVSVSVPAAAAGGHVATVCAKLIEGTHWEA